jgi:hypothetical protein
MKLGRRPVKASIEARIRELEAAGMGILKIGRTIGVGTSASSNNSGINYSAVQNRPISLKDQLNCRMGDLPSETVGISQWRVCPNLKGRLK